MRCVRCLLAILLLTMSGTTAMAGRVSDFETTTLDNGLEVITIEDFSCPIVAVQVWYHVGSKNESPSRQGFAHMFEHMMFRGTDVLGPEEHFSLVRRTGGSCNAFTSFDYTAYVNEVPANQLELALWLEAERMMFLQVDQENFETERAVVEEERRMDLNQPYGTVFERILPAMFQEHPYRWPPIGKIAHLEQAHADELKAFWDTYYVPTNAVLVICGAVPHKQARTLADKYFGWMPPLKPPPRVTIEEPRRTTPETLTLKEGLGPAPLVRLVYRGVAKSDADYVALQVLLDVLGDGESSRLYHDLVRERHICQDAYAFTYALEQEGLVVVGADLLPEGDIEEILIALREHAARFAVEPVQPEELTKVKNRLRRQLVTDALTVVSKARQVGRSWAVEGKPERLEDALRDIEAVEAADLLRVAKTYLSPERCVTVRVLPEKGFTYEPDASASAPYTPPAGSGKTGIDRPDSFAREAPVHELLDTLPEAPITEKQLPNGLKIVIVPNHEVPFATVVLGLRQGAWTEDPAVPGSASMALAMLTKGTANYTAAELAERIEFNALTLAGRSASNGQPSMDVGEVAATCLSDKLAVAMELLAEVTLRPTFPEEELAILKKQRELSLSVKEKDPSYIADRELKRRLYGNHPYSRAVTGDLADIAGLDRQTIEAWWREAARPDSAVLYVAGDVKTRKVMKLAKAYLGSWEKEGSAPTVAAPALPDRAPTHIYVVDQPGAVQSQIRIGQTSISRGHPDYHAARVYSHILGGGFDSRLNRSIRIEKGLTYGVWGGVFPQLFSGAFTCATFTKTATTGETVQAMLEVIRGMGEQPAEGDELSSARSYLVGSFARQLETPQDTVDYEWIKEVYGLPKDYLRQALEAYRRAETTDMVRVATEVVDPGRLTIVVVGDAAAVRDQLAAIAPVTVVETPEPR